MASTLPAPRRLDGACRSGCEFYIDADRCRAHPGWSIFRLAECIALCTARHVGHHSQRVLPFEPATRDIQSFSRAAARWQHWHYGIHGPRHRKAIYELAQNHAVSKSGTSRSSSGFPLLLRAGGSVCHRSSAKRKVVLADSCVTSEHSQKVVSRRDSPIYLKSS